MKASQLTLAVLLTAAFGSAAHAANVEGGSSNPNLIEPKTSDSLPSVQVRPVSKSAQATACPNPSTSKPAPRSASATNTAMRPSTAVIRTPM